MRRAFPLALLWSLLAVDNLLADACDCAPPVPPPVAADRATAVFTGRVTAVAPDVGNHRIVVKIAVSDVAKGNVEPSALVRTGASGASCGVDFRAGGKYVVYAHGRDADGTFRVTMCSPTREIP